MSCLRRLEKKMRKVWGVKSKFRIKRLIFGFLVLICVQNVVRLEVATRNWRLAHLKNNQVKARGSPIDADDRRAVSKL